LSSIKKKTLLNIITLNEQVEEETATRPAISHFFGQENFIFIRERSGKRNVCSNVEHKHLMIYEKGNDGTETSWNRSGMTPK